MKNITDGKHFENPFAFKDGGLVHISSVSRGLECGCVCPGCDGRLLAAKGEVNAHHFRHTASNGGCSWYSGGGGGVETEWHRAAKLCFKGIQTITGLDFRERVVEKCLDGSLLGEDVFIPFPSDRIEKVEIESAIDAFRPDVVLTFAGGRRLWLEVTVTNEPSPQKIEYLRSKRIEAVEVRVARTEEGLSSVASANYLASNPSAVKWIFNEPGFAMVEAARLRLKEQKAAKDREFLAQQRVQTANTRAELNAEELRQQEFEALQRKRLQSFPDNGLASPPPLLANLNDEQLAAVTLPAGHALILAGAGSGKTRVLTTRIAWLLQNGYATPGGILAVTFTNKAAKEMVARLSAMLPVNVRGMWIGTFHGLCNRLLRAHHKAAGLSQSFQILDTQDQLSAIKRLCKQHNVDDERFPPKQLAYFIAGCKEEGMRPGDVPTHDSDARKKVEIYQLYEEQCQREGVVDFGELMLRSYEMLRDNDPIREHYQRRFQHILVDEFQDTNKLQYAWLKQLAGNEVGGRFEARGSVIAVGDDDQSIYAFRGARVGNMADFVREFDVQRQIKLEQNYRSYSNILDSANTLISHNSRRLGKNLRTTQGAGEPVRVYEASSDLAEAQWMVDEIKQLVKNDGFERKEIAVLYRSNAQSRVIESALFNASVPYRVYGGLRFFERAEIKHALAYLRLLENPHDDTSFSRVVNFPPRGIGARSIEVLQDAARAAGCSLHDAVSAVPGKAGANLGAFVAMVDVLREQTQGLNLRGIIEQMLESTGLVEHFRTEKEGADRIENLQELVNAAESFVTQEGFGRDAVALPLDEHGTPLTQSAVSQGIDPNAPVLDEPLKPALPGIVDIDTGETLSPLAAFLSHAALEAGDNQAQAGQDAVQLMTVHASKGLEFDAVFIGGLEEGLFPHENSASDRDGLEEERRLMYVAITRARKRLYMSHSQTRMLHGQTRYNIKSRFFDELPEAALKWITPKQQGFGSYAPNSGAGGAYPSSARSQFGFKSETFASPPVPVQKTAPSHGLRAGINVFHTKFGEGKVLAIEGTGDDARAQVNFPRHGTKWLALSVAKLTVVE